MFLHLVFLSTTARLRLYPVQVHAIEFGRFPLQVGASIMSIDSRP